MDHATEDRVQDLHHPLILSSRVIGTPVFARTGTRLGHVADLSLEKKSGKAVYAIMSFGGFLGIGEKFHPLPWRVLNYDKAKDGYVVNLTKDQLTQAPSYARTELADNDLAWRQRVFDYYQTPPYWA